MRTLSYAIIGVLLGYGYPYLVKWTEEVLRWMVQLLLRNGV